MRFTWDPDKNDTNVRQHGIEFEDVIPVFADPSRLYRYDPEHSDDEDRWITIGRPDLASTFLLMWSTPSAYPISRGSSRQERLIPRMSDTTVHASLEYDDQGRPVVLTSDRRADRPRTDWTRLAAMTDAENRANAESDPDAVILTDEQRSGLRSVPNPRIIREKLGLSQSEFSRRFEIPLGTLRDWEQGRRFINATARALLRTIAEFPDLVEFANAPRDDRIELEARPLLASADRGHHVDIHTSLLNDSISAFENSGQTYERIVLNTFLNDLDIVVAGLAPSNPTWTPEHVVNALTDLRAAWAEQLEILTPAEPTEDSPCVPTTARLLSPIGSSASRDPRLS